MKKPILYVLATVFTLIVVGTTYLWMTFASPFFYDPVGELPEIDDNATYSVFVYGTLRKPWVRWLVMGRAGETEPAKLPGYRKEELDLEPDPNAVTEGKVITVGADELRALDRYERLGVRYERVKLTLKDGRSAWVYRLIEPALQGVTGQTSG